VRFGGSWPSPVPEGLCEDEDWQLLVSGLASRSISAQLLCDKCRQVTWPCSPLRGNLTLGWLARRRYGVQIYEQAVLRPCARRVGSILNRWLSNLAFHEKAGRCPGVLWTGKFISDVYLCTVRCFFGLARLPPRPSIASLSGP